MISRRNFICSSGLFVASTALRSFGQGLQVAQISLGQVIEAYQWQECPSWCWAASISMLFRFYGHPIDQKSVAQTLFKTPKPPCATSDPDQIFSLLNREWTDDNGDRFKCKTDSTYNSYRGIIDLSVQDIIDMLNGGDPLLLCTTHHAMVLREVRYTPGPILREMGVADPWPGSGLRSLNASEMLAKDAGGELTILASVDLKNVTEEGEKPSPHDIDPGCFGPLCRK